MQRLGRDLLLSPTDLTKHLACPHITTLDLAALTDPTLQPATPDEALELIFRLGLAHEHSYLQALRDTGQHVVDIPADATRAEQERLTVEAMHAGADVVYQARLAFPGWAGYADFLLRTDRPSNLGPWSYDIADTKLARKMKVPALLQMATYAEAVTTIQGAHPATVSVVTGDGIMHPWRLIDVSAFTRRARTRLQQALTLTPGPTEPVPVAHCGQCRWIERCDRHWHQVDDLSLVAFMRTDHRKILREAGITTLAQLGQLTPDELPRTISASSRDRLTQQARLQLQARTTPHPLHELLPPTPGKGLLRLPPPDPADLYLDFEGDPYAEGGDGREYLAGLGQRDGTFTALWAHDRDQERQLVTDLIDLLLTRWREHPDMHIYHYAPYEQTALKRLTARYGVREAELDQLLRGERLVDLYAVVRQGLRIGKSSYSIKKMEHFYWGHIRNNNPDVADAMSSVLAYERWCAQPDQKILDDIRAYNHDDVRSTLALHDWLEEQRRALEAEHGPQPRPDQAPVQPTTPPSAAELAETDLAAQLQHAGQSLLAGLVLFHRREARPEYWEIFRLADLTDDELVDDSAALGALSAPHPVGTDKRSTLYRYDYPPQDTKLQVGDDALDVDTHASCGTVHELDAVAGYVILKRQAAARHVRGLSEKQKISDFVIRTALQAVAADRLAGVPSLGGALLDRVVPSEFGELIETGLALNGQVLAVQGPPGSGKTWKGAALVRALIGQGRRVGVVANSHAVVGHFLYEVGLPAVQKCPAADYQASGATSRAESIDDVVTALDSGTQLVGGTAWLWSDPRLAGRVDALVIDEAGQFSLANAVACSRAARSLVLLGDPQQLPMPTRAQHPPGVGISVLEHLLNGNPTMPPDRGVFLDQTWRMHPELTAFVSELMYEGRLRSAENRDRQAIDGEAGLRVLFVEHEGNGAAAPEEATAVRALWESLIGRTFTDTDVRKRPLTAQDVLIVAPYNNQVGLLKTVLPTARVGTVDKFQGQQAPAVIYSMTSSSVEDAPRGVDFLYDLHRLNVAVSRAKALAWVVLSPRLLDAAVSTPEQLRQVNALCRLVDFARDRPQEVRGLSGLTTQTGARSPFPRLGMPRTR